MIALPIETSIHIKRLIKISKNFLKFFVLIFPFLLNLLFLNYIIRGYYLNDKLNILFVCKTFRLNLFVMINCSYTDSYSTQNPYSIAYS